MLLGGVHRNEGSVMRNPIDIDRAHSWAICQEIGKRLRAHLREEPELPTRLRGQLDRLRQLEGRSPPIAPAEEDHRFENTPPTNADGRDRSRPIWPWRRKS